MKILLTGGTGLIGRHLIPRLQALHHDITVVTRSPEKARRCWAPALRSGKAWRKGRI